MKTEQHLRVFLVEDSPAVLQALHSIVSEIRAVTVVGCANDAKQAERRIRRSNPDVVILDIRLKQSSGLDLLKRLKMAGERSPLVVIFTGEGAAGYRHEAARFGADFFFDKATEYHCLIELLHKLASGRTGDDQSVSSGS